MSSHPGSDNPADILSRLEICLADLDRIGADLPAVYVATAIEHLRARFDCRDDTSGSD